MQIIEYQGKEETFGGRKYKYLYCGEYKYWLTEINSPKQILINKAKI